MKVIIAIDQSVYWTQLIEAATKRRWHQDTAFKILTVLEPLQWETLAVGTELAQEVARRRQKLASQILSEARKIIQDSIQECTVHVELRQGSPRTEIINAATEWSADKLLLGAHGHSQNRLFAGSVSQAVAQHALCCVELVRLREPSEKATKESSRERSTASV
jgi:nucleotide-binding universal stress UspA family protein